MFEVTTKRIKSFAWRFGAYLVIAGLAFIGKESQTFNLPPLVIALIAYVIGEITKYINTQVPVETQY
jgi:hypothetical protein